MVLLSLLACVIAHAPPVVLLEPAAAARNTKAVGRTTPLVGVVGQQTVIAPIAAQSGEGALGDRLFRLDEHGLLEGCRWVESGRICELVELPDGTLLGGDLYWLGADGAPATPRAGGWVLRAHIRLGWSAGVVGFLFFCRFDDAGPRCLQAPPSTEPFEVLATFSLRDGDGEREVLWWQTTPLATLAGPGAPPTLHRCETAEDATEILCAIATQP